MKNRFSKICKRIAAFVAALIVGLPSTASLVPVSAAEKLVNEYDETRVVDDLGSATMAKLAAQATMEHKDAAPSLYTMAEYCYSEDEEIATDKFGIYLYVYNPSKIEIEQANGVNVVNVATAYEGGEPSEYSNLRLKFCGQSSGDYDKLVYKFRILDSNTMYAAGRAGMTKDLERRYDIAGIQLLHKGARTATDYTVGKTYFYKGYALGCDAESTTKSTLTVNVKELDTVDVELDHAVWRNTADNMQVNTVYFGIDTDVFETYGTLQKIKAQWYEYHTKPMFVMNEEEARDMLWEKAVGKNAKNGLSSVDWRIVWAEHWNRDQEEGWQWKDAWDAIDSGLFGNETCEFYCSWNVPTNFTATYGDDTYTMHPDWINLPQLDWVFWSGEISAQDDWNVSRAEVLEYAAKYTEAKDVSGGLYPDGPNKYAAALFEQDMDEARKAYLVDQNADCGLCRYEFDVKDDKWNWTSFHWKQMIAIYENRLKETMVGSPAFPDTYRRKYTDEQVAEMVQAYKEKHSLYGLDPFVVLDASALSMSTPDFASTYYISEDDVPTVKKACNAMIEAGKKPVLFRFAVTEYRTAQVRIDQISDPNMSGRDGYVAYQTVFLDFDVISFTFWKDGNETVLGCVASPIDIINGLDAPAGMPVPKPPVDWWYVIKMVLAIIGLGGLAFVVIWFFLWLRKQWNGGNY
ncbi:MAG: hypothetical protein E7357_01335 [Clostridiales bacterium]|nr:hypothetical protein [Clostridiales bacterium]